MQPKVGCRESGKNIDLLKKDNVEELQGVNCIMIRI